DRDATGPAEIPEMRADLVEQPRPDEHRIRALAADIDSDATRRDEPGRDRMRGVLRCSVAVNVERDVRVGVHHAALAQHGLGTLGWRRVTSAPGWVRSLLHRRRDPGGDALQRPTQPDDQSE